MLRTIRVGGACFELVWRPLEARAYGYVHEVAMAEQPEGVQVYRMPELLYLRARNDAAAQLLAKECCGL